MWVIVRSAHDLAVEVSSSLEANVLERARADDITWFHVPRMLSSIAKSEKTAVQLQSGAGRMLDQSRGTPKCKYARKLAACDTRSRKFSRTAQGALATEQMDGVVFDHVGLSRGVNNPSFFHACLMSKKAFASGGGMTKGRWYAKLGRLCGNKSNARQG